MSYNKEYERQYYIKNKEKISKWHKQYYKDNEERKEKDKKYYIKNREKILKHHKQWRKDNPEYRKQWLKNNPEYLKQWRKDNPEKTKEQRKKYDRKHHLNREMSRPMERILKSNKKGKNWEKLVDYTKDDLIKHLKSTIPEGYNWQDFIDAKLEIDHIIPIKAFKFKTPEDEEFKQCWSLDNLRLITKEENKSKYTRINPILLGLLIKEGELE
jgi:hypothetical protein